MKPSPRPPLDQYLFAAVLIGLVALGIILLLQDIGRQPPGKSRVEWPATKPAKP